MTPEQLIDQSQTTIEEVVHSMIKTKLKFAYQEGYQTALREVKELMKSSYKKTVCECKSLNCFASCHIHAWNILEDEIKKLIEKI